jgi:hypothetical protein
MAKAKQNEGLKGLEELLGKIETDVKRAKLMIHHLAENKDVDLSKIEFDLEKATDDLKSYEEDDMQVVEGVFDGYFMVGSDKKKYPVPLNYSSKSKLIPGDVLKLRIMTDGKLIYKLIGQANRQFVKATLSKSDDNKFIALTDEGSIYYLNQAAVSYFKGKTGDELSIIVNADGLGNFAAIEALISQQITAN